MAALLREQGAAVAVVQPHPSGRLAEGETVERELAVSGESKAAMILLRAIYQIRDIETVDSQATRLLVRGSATRVDHGIALLDELGMIDS